MRGFRHTHTKDLEEVRCQEQEVLTDLPIPLWRVSGTEIGTYVLS